MFVQELKSFPQGGPVISHSQEWDGCEVTVTLTYDHQNLSSSSLSPNGHVPHLEQSEQTML